MSCPSMVYQTRYNLSKMQDELRNLRKLQDEQNKKQSKISIPKSSEQNETFYNSQSSKKEHEVYKTHFSEVGKILSNHVHDHEHDRDELCWVGDKQVNATEMLARLLQTWAQTNQGVKKVQNVPDLKEKETALYKEFFNNVNKITADLFGTVGKAAYTVMSKDEESEDVTIEEIIQQTNANKQVGK